jgi:hypothetical protein
MMDIVDHEQYSWYLLRKGDDYYMDINLVASAWGITALVQLTPDECADMHIRGHEACNELAVKIQYGKIEYAHRDLRQTPLNDEVFRTIMIWRNEASDKPLAAISPEEELTLNKKYKT